MMSSTTITTFAHKNLALSLLESHHLRLILYCSTCFTLSVFIFLQRRHRNTRTTNFYVAFGHEFAKRIVTDDRRLNAGVQDVRTRDSLVILEAKVNSQKI